MYGKRGKRLLYLVHDGGRQVPLFLSVAPLPRARRRSTSCDARDSAICCIQPSAIPPSLLLLLIRLFPFFLLSALALSLVGDLTDGQSGQDGTKVRAHIGDASLPPVSCSTKPRMSSRFPSSPGKKRCKLPDPSLDTSRITLADWPRAAQQQQQQQLAPGRITTQIGNEITPVACGNHRAKTFPFFSFSLLGRCNQNDDPPPDTVDNKFGENFSLFFFPTEYEKKRCRSVTIFLSSGPCLIFWAEGDVRFCCR